MKKYGWQILLGLILIVMAASIFLLHYAIFHDTHHIFIYLLHDLAFIPIEVLIVSLIIHGVLAYREKRVMMKKLNMVIGAFYSEVGTDLLRIFSRLETSIPDEMMKLSTKWTDEMFDNLAAVLSTAEFDPQVTPEDFVELKDLLVSKKSFLLALLQNQNLLEHEAVTDLLWALLHLAEELENRRNFDDLPDKDVLHLKGDIRRARSRLLVEWTKYMKHLKKRYPYLFSLAVRTNPFDSTASVVIR